VIKDIKKVFFSINFILTFTFNRNLIQGSIIFYNNRERKREWGRRDREREREREREF